jgi:hypothetical protein
MIGGNYTKAVNTALTELLRSDEVDGVLGILPFSNSPLHQNLDIVEFVKDARNNSGNMKPLALWPYADEMLASLKITPMLKGLRGGEGIDWNGFVEIMERLSFLAYTLPDISELDINPIIATSNKCIAVDARILW